MNTVPTDALQGSQPLAASCETIQIPAMTTPLLNYYQAIEKASQDMLEAARQGNWDEVLKLEGACALLISQLKHSAEKQPLGADEAQFKSRIMQRILVNDAEIRQLAEPWLDELDNLLACRPQSIH